MKPKKQKRIRAAKRNSIFYPHEVGPVFVIRQSDVPALIEQLANDFMHAPYIGSTASIAYALKRAGITGPPKSETVRMDQRSSPWAN